MNINLIRLKGLIVELRAVRASIDRLADLKELEINKVYGLTTRTTSAKAEELAETQVAYTDPRFAEAASIIERQSGRKMTAEDEQRLMTALSEEFGDE